MKKVEVKTPAQEAAEIAAQMDAQQETAVATRRDTMELGTFVVPDDAETSLRLPRLSIAYAVGGMSGKFMQGSLVLDKEHLIAKGGDTVEIVLLCGTAYYKENRKFVPGQDPARSFDTKEQAAKEGYAFTDRYNAPESLANKTVSPAAVIKLLIKKPDGMQGALLTVPVLGQEYIPCEWFVDKTVAARTLEFLGMASRALSARGLLSGKITLMIKSEVAKNGNTWTYPVYKLVGSNTDEFIAGVKSALGVR